MIRKIRERANNFYLFQKYPVSKQFVKFCLVGTSNMILDILVYWFLTRIFNLFYLLAAVCSFIVAVSWSFYFNRRWTFRHLTGNPTNQYLKFFVANAVSMVLNLFLFFLLVDVFKVYDLLAKLMVAVIVAFFNFSLNKWWTFRKSDVGSRMSDIGN
ncbi:MAG: GtrA family protein [Patescibacteria group bacterium]